jgi:hypothetical protein
MVLLAGLLVTSLLIFLHHSLAITYQQSSCVIENTAVTASNTKDGTSYSIDFTYAVMDQQGQQVANREDNMGVERSYSSQDDAQQALDQYQIGSPHPCWYSPLAYPRVLLLKPDAESADFGWAAVWFFGTMVMLLLARWCILRWMVAPWRIFKYGVKASGTVVDHSVFKGWVTTIIEFQTHTEPPLKCRTKQLDLVLQSDILRHVPRLHSKIPVSYDPLRPGNYAQIFLQPSRGGAVAAMLIGFALLFLLVGGGSSLFIWWAFIFG